MGDVPNSIDELLNKPILIESEISHVDEDITSNTFSHYRAFIKFSQNIEKIKQNDLSTQIGLLRDSLGLINPSVNFSPRDSTIWDQDEIDTVALVLKMPKLIDSLITKKAFEDVQQIMSLWRRVTPIPVLQKVLCLMELSYDGMIKSLVSQLRSGTGRVSDLLKIVTVLRKSERFTETEIRLEFLGGKGNWIESMIHPVRSNSAYEEIYRLVDLYREYFFESVTQFSAIFGETCSELPPWLRMELTRMVAQLKSVNGELSLQNLTFLKDSVNFLCATLVKIRADFSIYLQNYYQELVLRYFDCRMNDHTRKLTEFILKNIIDINKFVTKNDYHQLIDEEELDSLRDYFGETTTLIRKVGNLVGPPVVCPLLLSISRYISEISLLLSERIDGRNSYVEAFALYFIPKLISEVEEMFSLGESINKLRLKSNWSHCSRLKCFDKFHQDALLPLKSFL